MRTFCVVRFSSLTLVMVVSLLAFGSLAQGQNPARQEQNQHLRQQRNQGGQQGLERQRRQNRDEGRSLKVGQYAPTFKLASLAGDEFFDLRDSRGKRPVILIFGSYT